MKAWRSTPCSCLPSPTNGYALRWAMSGRGIDFLENWVNKNVTDADRRGSHKCAKELAAHCLADAAALGITVDDMEPEWGSVEEIIYDAMQDILGEELKFWKAVAAVLDRRDRNETLH